MVIKDILQFGRRVTKPSIYTPEMLAAMSKSEKGKLKKMVIELDLKSANLTKKDIGIWRAAWQQALNIENPKRNNLYDVYMDVTTDLHLTGCIDQRQNMTLKKGFKIVDKNGKENDKLTAVFENEWFKEFMQLALDSRLWGYSLIEFGATIPGEVLKFDGLSLVPRKHVIPEYGVIVKDQSDEPNKGTTYLDGDFAQWCIGVGKTNDLGLLLKCSPEALSKKNMLAFWSAFGEIFGAPVRVAKTTSRDTKEIDDVNTTLKDMGAMAYGVFPEGTTIEFMETTRGDAFNVYDKRIDRANSELSKGILNQTMTIDSGSSLSQSEVHLEIFKNVIEQDADFIKDVINNKLIPFMAMKGFPVEGYTFVWDNTVDYEPAQLIQIEQMLLANRYEIPPEYFAEKYNIPITGRGEQTDFF
ncbi:MAG: DUF935 domain-containing protein [Bacteroidales bacterium]|jgi:hypothetical protein|nr:DUF935 domain-containing protein [Bacteroidales bacterium]